MYARFRVKGNGELNEECVYNILKRDCQIYVNGRTEVGSYANHNPICVKFKSIMIEKILQYIYTVFTRPALKSIKFSWVSEGPLFVSGPHTGSSTRYPCR